MTKTTEKKTETVSERRWALTCRNSSRVWPFFLCRTRADAVERGAKHFGVTPEYLKDRMGMKPVRVTLTYEVP